MLYPIANKDCGPSQIVNFNLPLNKLDSFCIYDDNGDLIDTSLVQFAYSLDNICWSCFCSYEDFLTNIIELKQDFLIKIKLNRRFSKIVINNSDVTDYSLQLASGFEFKSECNINSYTFNPYINMECAIGLQQQLTNVVSCLFGIPIYYFKVDPIVESKDITFKEYCLMGVSSIKQIKLLVQDGKMPSSKPEFSDLGLDWQTDWETDISKSMFATAFGNTAQPMEGDLIYIPMMKRMWMVNSAYEEKNDSLMWNATTFKVMLVKYQEKASLELGEADAFIGEIVKNKYENLFGDDENVESNESTLESPLYNANNLYPVYESDSVRKYMSCNTINYSKNKLYYKGSLISDSQYKTNTLDSTIVYQKTFCGDSATLSFVITPLPAEFNNSFINIGKNIKISISQTITNTKIKFDAVNKEILLLPGKTYFVYIRWSKDLNLVDIHACEYIFNENVPIYKLQPAHYYFNIDNPISSVTNYNIELVVVDKHEIVVNNIVGQLTNIKLFDIYIDEISDILQMWPTNKHIIINDTAREVITMNGIGLK